MAKTKIVFLVLPHINLLDLSGPDQVFLEALDYGADLELEYCSFTEGLYTTSGFSLGRYQHFQDIRFTEGDYLIVPGADVKYLLSIEFRQQQALFEWLKMAHTQGVFVCSVCTGAFVLALAGLLDGKQCTTHWKRTAELQREFPKAKVVENVLYLEDRRILTSAGVTAGIDLALHLVGRIKDELVAYKVARELVVYMRRQGDDNQDSIYLQDRNHIHGSVHKVQDWLQDHVHQKTTLDELAMIACMSTRNLTRVFRKETGISIHEFNHILQKERIKTLIKNPDISRRQIAAQCGLKSERQLFRLLQEEN
jgi:transcriptional regulator GlxA family with amidase domain